MHVRDLHSLYEFNSWANTRTLQSVESLSPADYARDLGSSHGGVHGTLVHTMGAEDIWLKRWQGESPARFYSAADFPTFKEVRERWAALDASLLTFVRYLAADADAQRIVDYRDLKGNPYSQPLWQLMQHLVNHSTYHRGQVVTMLRQLGATPASTDLVAFYRLHPGTH
jgi:uncharacterized damage-inducible protein DinB